MDLKGLKLPVTESDKMEASVLGRRLSEKAEHLPIKKRRFLFTDSSPQQNTSSSEGTESVAACNQSCSQDVHPKPDANCPPAASLHQSENNDGKMEAQKFVTYRKKTIEKIDNSGEKIDNSGTSVAPGTLDLKAIRVKLENTSSKETDIHIPTAPSENIASSTVANFTPDKSTLDNSRSLVPSESECTIRNQVTSNTQKSEKNDNSGTSVAPGTLDLKAIRVKLENTSAKETDIHIPTALSENIASSTVANFTPDKSTLDNSHSLAPSESECTKRNQVTSNTQKSEKNDNSGTSVAPGTLDFKAIRVKLENTSAKETDFRVSTAPSEYVASSTVVNSSLDKSALDNTRSLAPSESERTKGKQATSNIQKSTALDDRLNWDLNTVMAWEEQLESDHNLNRCNESESLHCEQGRERGSVSENIGNEIPPVGLKSLIPKIEGSELEECKPVSNDNRKLSSPVTNSVPLVAANKIVSLHNQLANSSIPDAIPSALTLEYQACEISTKHVNTMAAGTNFAFMPTGFGHGTDIRESAVSSKIVGSGSYVNHTITSLQTTENDKLKLSLVTGPSLENRVHRIETVLQEDDKANVKRVFAMENLISSGTESSHNVLVSSKSVGSGNYVNHDMTATENEKLNLSLSTAAPTELVVRQSGGTFDKEDDKDKVKRLITSKGITMENAPTTVSSMHNAVCSDAEVPLQHGKSRTDIPNEIINNNKEACDFENLPCDIQAGSEFDYVDEVSFGYEDSQFEDGEFRESSIQTWEGNDGEDREIVHGTENRDAFLTHENDSLKSTDGGSQKGTDETSSVLLPEKLDSSDQISGSEPNVAENCTTEVDMKDVNQSDQWKMNVSGSGPLPENHSSSSNISKIKDLSGIKSSKINEDLGTKPELSRFYRRGPSTRDAFLSRSRFRMQGSPSNADESASRFIRDSGVIRPIGRGKYIRGSGTRDRSPPFPGPSYRRSLPEDDHFTDKISGESNVTRGPFRSRLMVTSEEDEFRARLGLRPLGDTRHSRFVNVGRGRSLTYGTRHNDLGPRERYYGHPANDANDEPSMDYSHPFPARRRCFSPTHHRLGSISPPKSRTRSPISDGFRGRSRSPNLRSDPRMQRELNYRHAFESDHAAGGYNLEQSRNNISPPSSRIIKYRQRTFSFDRRSPPPGGERVGFYESSRKTRQTENYKSSRFSELHGVGIGRDVDVMDNGYRRGGFVRPFNDMGRPVKHIQYNEEDSYSPPVYDSRDKEALEFHGRGNAKHYINGTDTRFRDLPRRPREDRDKW